MKKVMVHVGLIMIVEDECKTDIIFNYAINTLGMDKQDIGIIRQVEVREVGIPSIDSLDEQKFVMPMPQGSNTSN